MDREMSVMEKADAKWPVIAVAPLPGDDECRPDCKKLPTTAEKKRVLASDEFRNTGSLISTRGPFSSRRPQTCVSLTHQNDEKRI